jgi:hypothetical protein
MVVCDVCNGELDENGFCNACKTSRKPYYRKMLGSKDISRDQFTIELNPQERAWLEALKVRWDFSSDSKVMKLCLENAISSNNLSLTEKTWRYFLSIKRQRKSNYEKLPEPTLKENAMQK